MKKLPAYAKENLVPALINIIAAQKQTMQSHQVRFYADKAIEAIKGDMFFYGFLASHASELSDAIRSQKRKKEINRLSKCLESEIRKQLNDACRFFPDEREDIIIEAKKSGVKSKKIS